jgi:hypothetical protein
MITGMGMERGKESLLVGLLGREIQGKIKEGRHGWDG